MKGALSAPGQWTLALLSLTVAAAIVYPPITKYALYEPGLGGREGDTGQYIRLYQGAPLNQVIKPFRYRVLTPYLARLVPDPPAVLLRYMDVTPEKLIAYRFGLVNMLGLAASGWFLIQLCLALGFTIPWSILGAMLFYTSFTVINFGGAPMVDAWSFAFLAAGAFAAVRISFIGLFLAAAIGMFAKETTLMLVLIVLLLAKPWRARILMLASLAPGIAAYLVFRHRVSAGGYAISSSVAEAFSNLVWRMQHGPYAAWILYDAATAFGLLLPFGLLGAWTMRGRPNDAISRLAWLVPFTLIVPFVNAVGIGPGVGRLWFYSFPGMIPLSLVGLQRVLGNDDPAPSTSARSASPPARSA